MVTSQPHKEATWGLELDHELARHADCHKTVAGDNLALLEMQKVPTENSNVAQYCNSEPAEMLGETGTSAAGHWRHWKEGSKERAAR